MKSDESLLGSLWRVTRSHLERTYIGENSRMNGDPDFEFFSRITLIAVEALGTT